MDEATEAGAEAFARSWMDALNEAYVTVDPSRLRALSQEGCVTCQAYIESLEKARSEGRSYAGGQNRVKTAVASPGLPQRKGLVLVDYDLADLDVLGASGSKVRTVSGGRNLTLRFDVQHDGSRWFATQVSPS